MTMISLATLMLSTVVMCHEVFSVMDDKHAYDIINNQHSSSNIPVSVVLQPSNTDIHRPVIIHHDSPSNDILHDFEHFHQSPSHSGIKPGYADNSDFPDLPPSPLSPTLRSPSYLPPVPPPPSSSSPTKEDLLKDKRRNEVLHEEIDIVSTVPVPPEQNIQVYNLVLNPEAHSWCELKSIRQIVTHTHCQSKEMENFVCVGSCFSYSVPQTMPETPGDEMLDYCDSCQAQESYWTTVELDCENDGAVYVVTKNIQKIASCSCAPCRHPRRPIHESFMKWRTKAYGGLSEGSINDVGVLMDGTKDSSLGNNLRDFRAEGRGEIIDKSYSQMTLRELKEEFELNAHQEALLSDKVVNKDLASFTADNEDEAVVS